MLCSKIQQDPALLTYILEVSTSVRKRRGRAQIAGQASEALLRKQRVEQVLRHPGSFPSSSMLRP